MKGVSVKNMEVRSVSKLIGQFAMVGQLGLSLLMPLLMCLFACYLLVTKLSVGVWVYIPGFILGLGASWMTAYKVYLSVVHKEDKKKLKRDPNEVNFSKHI
ncbi:AtpZ/AtpI family protein [Butyrivibrio sp. FCS014]|jgi:hypothetical protein|uniref:AtpZ/AtpI family protein n=1 Tax=Butyrivibrio sp. FCS014 TaxID=1408304 RepID=UPI0004AF14A7|nr:AtpZ/AtpI family protein [Butyrivibrio sp. FCS014]